MVYAIFTPWAMGDALHQPQRSWQHPVLAYFCIGFHVIANQFSSFFHLFCMEKGIFLFFKFLHNLVTPMSDPSAPSSKCMATPTHWLFWYIYIFRECHGNFCLFSWFLMKNLYFAIFALFGALDGRPHDPSSMFLTNLPFLYILAFKQSAMLNLSSICTFLMISCEISHFGLIWSPPCATPWPHGQKNGDFALKSLGVTTTYW